MCLWGRAAFGADLPEPTSGASAASGALSSPIVILIAHPSDASVPGEAGNAWFGAIAEAVMRFKLAAVKGVSLVPADAPAWRIPAGETSLKPYLEFAKEEGATHLLFQKYEVIRDRDIQYLCECIDLASNRTVRSIEGSFLVERAWQPIDSALAAILTALHIEPSSDIRQFLRTPVIGGDAGALRQLGATTIACTGGEGNVSQCAQEYVKVAASGGLLACYVGARACMAAKQYLDAAVMIETLLPVTRTAYPHLYIDAAECFRRLNRPDDALRMALLSEKNGLYAPELSIIKARAWAERGDRRKAQDEFQRILQTDPDQPDALVYLARMANNDSLPDSALAYAERILRRRGSDADALIEKGRSLVALRRYTEARTILMQAAQTTPADARLNLLLADVCAHLGEDAQAVTLYDRALKGFPENPDVLFRAAQANLKTGRHAQALGLLNRIPYPYAGKAAVQRGLGLTALILKDSAKARTHLENYYRTGKRDYDVLVALGVLRSAAKDYDGALHAYLEALDFAKDRNPCRFSVVNLFFLQNTPGQALPYALEILVERPDDPSAVELAARSYEARDSLLRAAAMFERLVRMQGGKDHALHVGELYEKAGDTKQAISRYVKNTAKYPGDVRNYERLGALYLTAQDFTSAQKILARAVTMHEAPFTTVRMAATAFELGGKTAQAIEYYRRYLKSVAADTAVWMALGKLLLSRADYPMALAAFTKAADLDKSCRACSEATGDLYYLQKKYRQSIDLYERLRQGANDTIWTKLGRAYLADGRDDRARQCFEKAVELNPLNEEASYFFIHHLIAADKLADAEKLRQALPAIPQTGWGNLSEAEISEARGRTRAALTSFKTAARMLPENPAALAGCGRTSLDQDYSAAAAYLERAAALRPSDPAIMTDLAAAYRAKRHHTKALGLLYKAAKLDEKNAAIYASIGALESIRKNPTRAIESYRKALKYDPRLGATALALGNELRSSRRYNDAIDAYKQAAKYGSTDVRIDAYRWTGNIYYSSLKDRVRAKEYYRKYVSAGGKDPALVRRSR